MGLCAMYFGFQILYQQLGAGFGGFQSKIALFFAIIGVGGLVNLNYILMELRLPPETLGASMVIMLTIVITTCSLSP